MTPPTFTYDWTTPHATNWLQWLQPLIAKPQLRLLTIGAAEGRSEIWLLEHVATAPTATLHTIEPGKWPRDHALLLANHATHPAANRWTIQQQTSVPALLALHRAGRTFHAAYLDGDHTVPAAYFDIALTYDMLEPQGILIIDDLYHPDPHTNHGPEIALALAKREWTPTPREILAPTARHGQAAIFKP
jgi:predicted O-methyltransferase YrrM